MAIYLNEKVWLVQGSQLAIDFVKCRNEELAS